MMDINLMKMLESGNGLIFAGAVLFIGALVILARVLTRAIDHLSHRHQAHLWRRRFGMQRAFFHLSVMLLLVFLALALLFAGTTLKTYTAFTRVELVGIMECLEWNSTDQTMIVRFSPVRQDGIANTQTLSLYGDQWEISAHILKWAPTINLLGVHTGYRLHQIKGTYSSTVDESRRPHKAYALSAGQDWVWTVLSRYGEKLPFVEAVYGNAVSRPAKPGEQLNIFVTTSGLSIRPNSRP